MPGINKLVRQSLSLPSSVAARVKAIARAKNQSANKVLLGLVELGLEAQERERERFLALADQLVRCRDAKEQRRLKEQLAKLTFGD